MSPIFFLSDGVIMNETQYQRKLVNKIKVLLPGAQVLKNDPSENQGIPDIIILFGDQWAMLEVKISATAPERPNQPYYVNMYNKMSFAAFIHPQNEEQVLDDLQSAFGITRKTRISQS